MTATDPISSMPEEEPAFNAESVLRRCGGDARFAAAVAEQFRKQAPTEMARLDAALAAGDVEVFRRTVHGLKSMAAFVSADAAAEVSGQLEDLAQGNQLGEVGSLMRRLHDEIGRVVAGISSSAELPPAKCA
jgi:HPt (histidine-containing phosphotransfer) domain-containing protein